MHSPLTIVGIGASAGGLAALKVLFGRLPQRTGIAFVVVVHLSPEHASHLSELLQPHCRMPVQQVTETVRIEPDRVYVIPPGANLNTIDTHLRLSDLEAERSRRAPIDHFFRTLAEAHDGHAIAVVLTGTGSDGTLGTRRVKEAGGVTIAQDPGEAEYDSMPRSAIASGMVDLVLPLENIPVELLRLSQTRPRVGEPSDAEQVDEDDNRILQKIFAQVRARTAQDFSQYKRSTIMRRIRRRMQLQHIETLADYLEVLRERRKEAVELANDLLITVTEFFRDRLVFERLEKHVLPRLFEGKTDVDHLRVWSIGCSTGEEAYSLAVLLLEEAGRRDSRPHIQVFASDLHELALRKAREGVYPLEIADDVSPERLRRFFMRENDHYRIRREVRELVIFAPHNVLRDPPFSHQNLIVCRNLLIYLQRDVQQDLMALFHYALEPEGLLLVGASEAMDRTDLFVVEDKQVQLHRKRNVPVHEPPVPVFPLMSRMASASGVIAGPAADATVREVARRGFGALHERVVERYGPPSVLVDQSDNVVHYSAHAGAYLRLPGGEPTNNIFRLALDPLRLELGAALHAVRKGGRPRRSRPVTLKTNGEERRVLVRVRPATEPDLTGFCLILFDELEPTEDVDPLATAVAGDEARASATARELEQELQITRQRLQDTIDQYEGSRKEMQAANEELQSANEELRSTMEELETSKEELQSMNEELVTVNQENRHRVEELDQLSGDLQHLMAATDIATLFLDRELRIVRFTPKISELFNIRQSDRGRALADLTHRLGYPNLLEDAEQVLRNLAPVERETEDENARWYLTRILPYRSGEDRIAGVVITFIDISRRRQAEEALRGSEVRLARELEDARALQQVSTELVSEHHPRGLYEHMLDALMAVMRSDAASIQALDAEAGELVLLGWRGFDPESARYWERVKAGQGSGCGIALDVGGRIIVRDLEASDIVDTADLIEYQRCGLRSMQATPLISRSGRALGMMSTHWHEPHDLTDDELARLDVLARQAADLIERAEAERALRANAERQAFLLKLSDALRPLGDPIEIQEVACRTLGEQLGADQAFYAEVAEENGVEMFVVERAYHTPSSPFPFGRYPTDAFSKVIALQRTGQTIVVSDVETDPMTAAEKEAYQAVRAVAFVAAPLIKNGRLVGALTAHQTVPRQWKPEEVELVQETAERTWAAVERAQAEEALRAAKVEADQANQAKDRFLAVLSHELRTPLSPVLLEVSALEDREDLPSDVRDAMKMVRRNVEIETRLINDLLDLSRVLSGKLKMERHPVNLSGVVSQAIHTCGEELHFKKIELTRNLTAEPGTVLGDAARLQQVFWNLIKNAIKFTPEGGTIDVASEHVHGSGEGGEFVRVRLRDSGMGIPPDALRRIFDAFEQAGADVPHKFGGLGLGLSVSKAIVESHDGGISAHSEGLGRGAEFVVELPLALAEACEAAAAGRARSERGTRSRGGVTHDTQGLRLLLVEDHADTAHTLAALLRLSGHEVELAHTAAAAQELVVSKPCDIVISDIGLPDATGHELMRRIREHCDIKGIALSGYGREEDIQASRNAGFSEHLVKPVDIDQVLDAIRRIVASR